MKRNHLADNGRTSGSDHSVGYNLKRNSGQMSGQNNSEQVVAAQILPEESGQDWKEGTCI